MSTTYGLRLLVVEDDVIVARALDRTLTRRGHVVSVVGTCAEARALKGHFDCAVLDVHLPDGNGIELAREISGSLARAVVFFSGSSDEPTRLQACDYGTFVPKSAGIDELEVAVRESVREASEALLAAGAENTPNGTPKRATRSGTRRKTPF